MVRRPGREAKRSLCVAVSSLLRMSQMRPEAHYLYELPHNRQVAAKSAVTKHVTVHKSRDGEVRIVMIIFMTPCSLVGG
jgi:hypothetical protein